MEILELPNLSYMTTSTVYFESHDKIFGDVTNRSYDITTFISKYLYFKKAKSSQFWWNRQKFNHFYSKNFWRLKKS